MHNLATINGRVAMAYQGETPWHRLGKRMAGTTDVAAALTAANLDWRVALAPLYLGDGRLMDDRKAVVRDVDHAIIGSVGARFQPIQNADAFGVLQDACRVFGVTIESAGALGNGARTWMLAKLPTDVEVVPGDTVKGYVLFTNGHDGSLRYGGILTPIRVVCQNTLSMATASQHSSLFNIRHTASAADRIREVERLIERLIKAMQHTGETFSQLAARSMSIAEVAAYIERVLPTPAHETEPSDKLKARRATIASLVWHGKGAQLAGSTPDGSTAWACYNAVAEYYDHVRPAEATSANAKQSANEAALFGTANVIKQLALAKARALVAA